MLLCARWEATDLFLLLRILLGDWQSHMIARLQDCNQVDQAILDLAAALGIIVISIVPH
jgi:hypothetical protein